MVHQFSAQWYLQVAINGLNASGRSLLTVKSRLLSSTAGWKAATPTAPRLSSTASIFVIALEANRGVSFNRESNKWFHAAAAPRRAFAGSGDSDACVPHVLGLTLCT